MEKDNRKCKAHPNQTITNFKSFFEQAREEAQLIVQRAFDQLQANFNMHLEEHKRKTGLLCQARLHQIYSDLNKESLNIYNVQQQLNSYSSSNKLGVTNLEIIPKLKHYLEEVGKEITTNEQFQPNINYKPSNLEEVAAAIKKLITTSVSYPMPQYEQNRARILSRTPLKDSTMCFQLHPSHQQNRQLSLKKSNIAGFKNTIQIKSPRGFQNNYLIGGKNTMKQSSWLRPETQTKIFSNTYSG